jgi:hypothetical protein
MKEIIIIIILFTSLKNYSQEIQFVKEYNKFSYKDTDGKDINKNVKSYVYFYQKGKVKIKIIDNIEINLFFTETEESENFEIMTTYFKGVDDKGNKIRGFYTDKSLSVLTKTSTLILNKKNKVINSNPKENNGKKPISERLIRQHFSINKLKNEKQAYLSDNEFEIVEFHYSKKYKVRDKEYNIVLFSLQNISIENDDRCKFSVVKFIKKNNKWEYLNRWDNLEIGTKIGKTIVVPELINVDGYNFLELKDIAYWGQGYHKYSEIFNTNNFKRSFITYSDNFSENVEKDVIFMNKNLKDMRERYSDEHIPSATDGASNNQVYKIFTSQNQLFIINEKRYAEYDEKLKEWRKIEKNITYIFNPKTLLFEKKE